MTTYNITFKQTEYRTATVEAGSERDARRKFDDGEYTDTGFMAADDASIMSIAGERPARTVRVKAACAAAARGGVR